MSDHSDPLAAFRRLPLPTRMREAAEVADVVNERIGKPGFCAGGMREFAAIFEAEDEAAAEQEQLVEELAQTIFTIKTGMPWLSAGDVSGYRRAARSLLERFTITPKDKG